MSTKPQMIRKCLWPACLMGLLITGILSLDCNLLNRVTRQNLKLLSRMRNSFPMKCLKENKAFEMPQEILYSKGLGMGQCSFGTK